MLQISGIFGENKYVYKVIFIYNIEGRSVG